MRFREKVAIAKMKENELHRLHQSLGLHIRVVFGLWFGNEDLMASCMKHSSKPCLDPEDASPVVIKELWRRLKGSHGLRIV
jgi:hypothetical protein